MTQDHSFSLNGNRPQRQNQNREMATASSPLRIVFFSPSIVSDWGNPAATTVRAVMRALIAAGHETVHLEERKNRPTVELLRARGSAALRAFTERYADLPYRTYELPTGLERTVWFVRQISTADAVVIFDGTPEGVLAEAARVQTRHLTRLRWSIDPAAAASWVDIVLTPISVEAMTDEFASDQTIDRIILGPAVEPHSDRSSGERSGTLLIAYDDQELAEATRHAITDLHPTCLSAGSVAGDHWQPVSEVALSEHYQRAALTIVADASDNPFAIARGLLPIAAACPTINVRSADSLGELPTRITVLSDADVSDVPPACDATIAARRLVELVRVAQHRRLSHRP
jgi:hypothetical protein